MTTPTTLRTTFIVSAVLVVLARPELPSPSSPLTMLSRPVISSMFSGRRSSILIPSLRRWCATVVTVVVAAGAVAVVAAVDTVVAVELMTLTPCPLATAAGKQKQLRRTVYSSGSTMVV